MLPVLLRFRVANYRSIREDQELSLVATEFNEGTARATGVRAEGREVRVLPVAGIYGANASGKSNVLMALEAMCDAVRRSFAEWAKEEGVPREPFALDPRARDETTLFEVDLLLGKQPVRYTYGFEVSDERVEAEWLHAYPHRQRQVWFDRDASRPDREEFAFPGKGMEGSRTEKERLAEFTRPNSLLLTVAASLNHPQLSVVHRWFTRQCWLATHGRPMPAQEAAWLALRWETEDVSNSPFSAPAEPDGVFDRFTELLRKADLGVAGMSIDVNRPANDQVRLLHHTGAGKPVPLSAWQESKGTLAWIGHLGPALRALDHGALLVMDELDASLHPTLSAELIRLFKDSRSNPRGAQLIFTTHDASLLGSALVERPLDRDEVWITVKRRTGETELYPLIDAKPRKGENLERGYLRGRYGGIPRVTTGDMAREVARSAESQ
jgi:predicted ATPase